MTDDRNVQLVYRARQSFARSVGTSSPSTGPLPPGPTAPRITQLGAFLYEPVAFLESTRRRYGEIVTLRLPGMFTLVQIHRPHHVQQMFRSSGDNVHAGEANAVLEPFLGPHSLLMLDGKRHLRHRRLLLPPFRGQRMRAYGDAMVRITERHIARMPTGSVFSFQPHSQAITLDIIMETVFGVRSEQDTALRDMLGYIIRLLDNPLYIVSHFQRDLGPRSPWGRYLRLRKQIQGKILRLIERSRSDDLESRDDILSMLLLARDDEGASLSDAEVHDELVTLLVAGHETTATAISWAVHRLTCHSEILARVVDELDESKAPYLNAFLRETLRVHPVIPGVGRVLKTPMDLAGYRLPAGVTVGCSTILAHTDAESWTEPKRFDPARFLDRRPNPYSYFPFGGGVRRCIGEAFALFEMRAVLQTLLRVRRPQKSGHTIRNVRRNITLSPSGGMPLVLKTI